MIIEIDLVSLAILLIGIGIGYGLRWFYAPEYIPSEKEEKSSIAETIKAFRSDIIKSMKLNEEQQKTLDEWIGKIEAIEKIPLINKVIRRFLK